jgi:hypothetical protein
VTILSARMRLWKSRSCRDSCSISKITCGVKASGDIEDMWDTNVGSSSSVCWRSIINGIS